MDEGRVGLIPRRLWGVRGEEGKVPYGMKFQWRYVVAAGEVQQGELAWTWLERARRVGIEGFLKDLKESHPEQFQVVFWDGAGWHKGVKVPEGMVVVTLPPASPELNPAELIVREIRGVTANGWWEEIEAKVRVVEGELRKLAPEKERVRKMLGYAWILAQIEEAEALGT